jgi:hypothetical protein
MLFNNNPVIFERKKACVDGTGGVMRQFRWGCLAKAWPF